MEIKASIFNNLFRVQNPREIERGIQRDPDTDKWWLTSESAMRPDNVVSLYNPDILVDNFLQLRDMEEEKTVTHAERTHEIDTREKSKRALGFGELNPKI